MNLSATDWGSVPDWTNTALIVSVAVATIYYGSKWARRSALATEKVVEPYVDWDLRQVSRSRYILKNKGTADAEDLELKESDGRVLFRADCSLVRSGDEREVHAILSASDSRMITIAWTEDGERKLRTLVLPDSLGR